MLECVVQKQTTTNANAAPNQIFFQTQYNPLLHVKFFFVFLRVFKY